MTLSLSRTMFAAATLLLIACSDASMAQQDKKRLFLNPPSLNDAGPAPSAFSLLEAGEPKLSLPPETTLELNVVYTDGAIYNPATDRNDLVRLRSYQGRRVDSSTPFVSPTIDVSPGDTVRITLNNKLPPDSTCTTPVANETVPHCFNGTNLHAHGLWVNPAGNGDNVLISINPGVSFQYEYKIARDHPAGTFWYHTHRHGSTAIQVSSGMAGAFIVRGRRLPTETATGDIDTLLRPTKTQPFTERIVVMQQINYVCRDSEGKIKLGADNTFKCDQGDIGTVDRYDDQFTAQRPWKTSGHYTSINGQVQPTFLARAGKIERWRIIHAGVRDTISLQFRELKQGAASAVGLTAANNDKYVGDNCTGAPLVQHLIAADGLTLATAVKTDVVVFQPGYRWDAVLVFPKPATYCVINTAAPIGIGGGSASRQLIGFVVTEKGDEVPEDITAYLTANLVSAAVHNMPASIRARVVSDLNNGLKFTRFQPHPDIKDEEVTGAQRLVFDIDMTNLPARPEIDGKSYDPNRLDRILKLGGVDEWTLTSDRGVHPFHIHINPFQIVKIIDPNGNDVSAPDAVDSFGGFDPQYRGLKGIWKDTLLVKNVAQVGQPPGKYTIVLRTRYRRYIGDFVLHCHILDHEDEGMMQNVRISLPDGAGGISHEHR